MYKADPQPGWKLLDEFHSPAMTARYVRERRDGYHDVVDVSTTGAAGEYTVTRSVERGVMEESADGSRPYIHTDVKANEVVARNVTEDRAYDVAARVMNEAGSRAGHEFDFGGGL